MDRANDVTPDVGSVVPIKVDDLLLTQRPLILVIDKLDPLLRKIYRRRLRWRQGTMAGNLVKIILVGLRPDNVNDLVEGHLWVLL